MKLSHDVLPSQLGPHVLGQALVDVDGHPNGHGGALERPAAVVALHVGLDAVEDRARVAVSAVVGLNGVVGHFQPGGGAGGRQREPHGAAELPMAVVVMELGLDNGKQYFLFLCCLRSVWTTRLNHVMSDT